MTATARRIAAAVIPLAVFASCIASTSDGAGSPLSRTRDGYPTNFDYLVLASIADSQQPFTMAGYHSTSSARPE
jgi:hypothetical protein